MSVCETTYPEEEDEDEKNTSNPLSGCTFGLEQRCDVEEEGKCSWVPRRTCRMAKRTGRETEPSTQCRIEQVRGK